MFCAADMQTEKREEGLTIYVLGGGTDYSSGEKLFFSLFVRVPYLFPDGRDAKRLCPG